MAVSAGRAPMVGMTNRHRAFLGSTRSAAPRSSPRRLVAAVPAPVGDPVVRLSAALEILASGLRDAVAERRTAPQGSERYRRADERVAYLNELYVRLQRRMEVPPEIWHLEAGRSSVQGRRARAVTDQPM